MGKGVAQYFACLKSFQGFTSPVEAFLFLDSFQKKGGEMK
jgi:hypothetical protein